LAWPLDRQQHWQGGSSWWSVPWWMRVGGECSGDC
jgi:hypothetical protein